MPDPSPLLYSKLVDLRNRIDADARSMNAYPAFDPIYDAVFDAVDDALHNLTPARLATETIASESPDP